jgi:hypothetical protein
MKLFALAVFISFGTAVVAPHPVMAQQFSTASTARLISVPVTGSGGGGTFAGTFRLQQFAPNQGQIVANGLISGMMTAANGTTTSVAQTVSVPVQAPTPSCQLVHLDLGPLNLNVLAVQVSVNPIAVDIAPQLGSTALNSLLCSTAGVANNPTDFANTLNQILNSL